MDETGAKMREGLLALAVGAGLQAFVVTSPLAATPVHATITLLPTRMLPLNLCPR